jgi:hypothetical protein
MPAQTGVAWLSGQRRARNVAHRATKGLRIVAFQQHYREPQARNFQPSNQAFGRRAAVCVVVSVVVSVVVNQQALQMMALPLLENPGVRRDERAIAQQYKRPGE